MQRTASQFEQAAIERGIGFIPNHDCSFCHVTVGWRVYEGGVAYDSSCGCSWSDPRSSSWAEVAEHFNRNQPERNDRISPERVAEMDAFWGFDPPAAEVAPAEPRGSTR